MGYPADGQYIDIHSHRLSADEDEWVLTSLFAADYPPESFAGAAYSVGLHPMHVSENDLDDQLKKIRLAAENQQVLAIGECGLDALVNAGTDLQRKAFEAQVEIAEYAGLPVIIHAVKSFNSLIDLMRSSRPGVPMIIHGYRGSTRMAMDLVKHGFYLSLGSAVLKDRKTTETAGSIPSGRLLLETDDSDAGIREIYERVAGIRNTTPEALRDQVHRLTMELLVRDDEDLSGPGENEVL